MTARADAETREEREGDRRAQMALDRHREQAGLQLVGRQQFDLANLTDEEFEAGLRRMQLRQARMRQILEIALIKGVHYSDEGGVFKKPILKKAGQEDLRTMFRLQLVHVQPPIIHQAEDYVSVVVTVGVQDGAGRLLAPHTGACNSRERRFKTRDGTGYTYADARETLNDCLAMAEKRAGCRATMEVTGATAFLANEEEMDDALTERGDVPPESPPWTDAEKAEFTKAARAAGIRSGLELEQFVVSVLGSERPVLQRDVPVLIEALAGLVSRRTQHVRKGELDADSPTVGAEAGDATA